MTQVPPTQSNANPLVMGVRAITWCVVKIWGVLWNDKVPLIVNIVLIGATAWITYGVAPHINGTFERQKIQSAYVLENLRSINSYISELYVEVGEISYAISDQEPAPEENIKKARETINRLNWKLIETAAVLKEKEDLDKLEQFQIRLEKVRRALDGANDAATAEALSDEVRQMSIIGVQVIQSIGERASLDPKVEPN